MRRPWISVLVAVLVVTAWLTYSEVRGRHNCGALAYQSHLDTRYDWMTGCEVLLVGRWIPEGDLWFRSDGLILERTKGVPA